MPVLLKSDLNLPVFGKGKVRDTYDLGDKLLVVATDRVSAFDVVLPNGIPDKGKVLNQLSAFWFQRTTQIINNHLIAVINDPDGLSFYVSSLPRFPSYLAGRSMLVRKAERIPVECVVRGYLSGSAWSEYKSRGTVCKEPVTGGLRESEKLPEPLFTPTTKAEEGHDEPLGYSELEKLVGRRLADDLRGVSLAIYEFARDYAAERGIIIADTKFEFGIAGGKLMLIDEALTPDSSRFWDSAQYVVGSSPPSFDKQPVRDWLTDSGWNKEPPAPRLPADVVRATSKRYREAYRRLTGFELE